MASFGEEVLSALPTEARNEKTMRLDELSTLEMLTVMNAEDALVAASVQAALPEIAAAVDAIAARFALGGRLFYVGAGTSGRLGVLDASECPPTFSVDAGLFVGVIAGGDGALRRSSEGSEDSVAEGRAVLKEHGLRAQDTVCGIAASGRTPFVLGALARAAECGALTLALTCAGGARERSRMAQAAAISIELATGPEVLTGSTRLKAGTATKLVLNMISTGVMVRQGAVFSNLMVNVQTTNVKLVNRAERILAAATGCNARRAAELLRVGGSVKVGIVMEMVEVGREEAELLLTEQAGNLRLVLLAAGK